MPPAEPGTPTVTQITKRGRPSVLSVLTPQLTGALISTAFAAFSSEMIFALSVLLKRPVSRD